MASSNNLGVLFADVELPFGHLGRRFDDTPEGFSQSPLEVWPESHWPGFALRQSDVFQSYAVW